MPTHRRFSLVRGGLGGAREFYRGSNGDVDWEAVRQGFREGADEAVALVSQLIEATLRQCRLPAHEVEDVLMDVLSSLHRHRDAASRGSYASYVMTAARNRFTDWCRRNSRVTMEAAVEPTDGAALSYLDEAANAALISSIKQLNHRQRVAIQGRYFSRKTDRELGRELGISESSVRRLVAEARSELYRLMIK